MSAINSPTKERKTEMKHKVFILQYHLNQIPDRESGKHQILGNLDDLNKLLEEDWEIQSYELLASQWGTQNILYHLCEKSKGVNISV